MPDGRVEIENPDDAADLAVFVAVAQSLASFWPCCTAKNLLHCDSGRSGLEMRGGLGVTKEASWRHRFGLIYRDCARWR